jgi:PrtD family type I secretion system ABC transporter
MKKSKKNKQNRDYLAPYAEQIKRSCLLLMLFTSLINMLILVAPFYQMAVIDRVLGSHSVKTLIMLTIIALCAALGYAFFTMVRKAALESIAQWIQEELSPKLFAITVHKQSVGIPVSVSDGQRDVETIKNFITSTIPILLDIPWAIIFLLFLYTQNAIIANIILLMVLIIIAAMLAQEKWIRPLYMQAELNQDISRILVESAANSAESIEAMGMMPELQARFEEYRTQAATARQTATFYTSYIDAITHFIPPFLRMAVIAISAYVYLEGLQGMGEIIFFMILSSMVMTPFLKSAALYKGWSLTTLAYRKINDIFIAQDVLKRGSYELPEPTGHISVEQLVYTPYKAPTPIIKGVTFQLPAGASMSIIGPAAAGKTTLSKLIIGLIAPTHGAVRLDGAETYQWERRNFGKYTGYMPQNTELFLGTIKDNVARMDKSAPLEAVIEACKMAECHDMIMALPAGYDTVVKKGSHALSPGQTQRIGLARALYGKPKFVLLDEPNINLDDDGEAALLRAIHNIKAAKISLIVVAHRPQVVASLDYMLVLKNGVIERIGHTNDIISSYRAKASVTEINN